METHAIVRFINYSVSTPEKAARLAEYIKGLDRTDKKFVRANYLSPGNAKHGLDVIEDRWKPKGKRFFKQGILSFGMSCADLAPEKAAEITEEVLGFYKNYPWIAAVHTNKPNRIHSHFLLVTTNIRTGKKLSQAPRDLQDFKDYFDSVAERYGLLRIGKSKEKEPTPEQTEQGLSESSLRATAYPPEFDCLYDTVPFGMGNMEIRPLQPSIQQPTRQRQAAPNIAETVLTVYQKNMARFFMLGYGKER